MTSGWDAFFGFGGAMGIRTPDLSHGYRESAICFSSVSKRNRATDTVMFGGALRTYLELPKLLSQDSMVIAKKFAEVFG